MKNVLNLLFFCMASIMVSSCDYIENFEERAVLINGYEQKALSMAKENRLLKLEVSKLEYEVQSLTAKNKFLTTKLQKFENPAKSRGIASISKNPTGNLGNDLVKQDIYKWSPTQLLSIGEKAYLSEDYEKSAQYFYTYLELAEDHKSIDDGILFQAGLAAYESRKHYSWALSHFDQLIQKHPNSKHYRGAKLWRALTVLKQGDKKSFYNTVEEFRKKYRNTPEWDILRGHYEEITQLYKD